MEDYSKGEEIWLHTQSIFTQRKSLIKPDSILRRLLVTLTIYIFDRVCVLNMSLSLNPNSIRNIKITKYITLINIKIKLFQNHLGKQQTVV